MSWERISGGYEENTETGKIRATAKYGSFDKIHKQDLKEQRKEDKLHEALITIAEKDVGLLSYRGQTLWNKLASKTEKKLGKVI